MCQRRNALRDAVERDESDQIFVKSVLSEDDIIKAKRDEWLRELTCPPLKGSGRFD